MIGGGKERKGYNFSAFLDRWTLDIIDRRRESSSPKWGAKDCMVGPTLDSYLSIRYQHLRYLSLFYYLVIRRYEDCEASGDIGNDQTVISILHMDK